MTETAALARTLLFDRHVALGAKLAPFGGFEMPIQYAGILAEHAAARTQAAIFDTCHMGEFRLAGPSAAADLDRLVSCDVAGLPAGRCRYGLLCNAEGGVIDDLLVYRLAGEEFMLVVNAGTQDGDFAWVSGHLSPGTRCANESAATAKVDVQGPAAPRLLRRLLAADIAGLRFYAFHANHYGRWPVLVSRTGYTGEVGFEVYGEPDAIRALWDDCLAAGAAPAGLGARDTLRLEMGMPLYGHELSAARNAGESGLDRAFAPGKDFIGAAAVRDGARRRQALVGLTLAGRRAARAGDAILDSAGRPVGAVTSGSFGPSVGVAIALGYVDRALAAPGTALAVQTARQALDARVAALPFYAQATARRALAEFL